MPARFERFDRLCTASTPVEAGGEDRRGLGRELDVALVARDDDAARSRPCRDRAERLASSTDDRRVARLVDPQHQRAGGVGFGDRRRDRDASRRRRGTGTARQPARIAPISYVGYATAGYSTVSRCGRAQPQQVRQRRRRTPSCRRTRRSRRASTATPKRRVDPRRRGFAQRGDCPPTSGNPSTPRSAAAAASDRDVGNRVARCADRAVDDAAGQRCRPGASSASRRSYGYGGGTNPAPCHR